MMREPDTRRAIAAMLAMLNAIGAELGRKEADATRDEQKRTAR